MQRGISVAVCAAFAAIVMLSAGPSAAEAASEPSASEGEALYASRCAGCHDKPSGRTPGRDVLAQNPPSFILRSLTVGAMSAMADGLSDDQKAAIARYVSRTDTVADVDPARIWGPGAAGTPLSGPKCAHAPPPVDLNAPKWNGWSPRPDNARFQPDPGLTADHVPKLRLKWAFNYPGSKNGQATVVGDRVFVTSMSGAVYALDAKTGCVHWRHEAEAGTRSSVTVVALPEGAPARHALFFSDWTKSAVALDADTGQQLWKTKIDASAGLQMTGAPTVHGGRLFVPISSGVEAFGAMDEWECCKFRGSVVALDLVTGKILWQTHTIAQEPRPFGMNRLGRTMYGPAGGAIWSAPTVDPGRGLIYVGTSNSYTVVPHDGSDSVIAMDMATGQIRWKVQLLKDDNYIDGCWPRPDRTRPANCPSPLGPDFSIGNSPILADLPGGRQLLVVGQKSGEVHALDPENSGRRVWTRRLSPGSALGGVEFGMASDGTNVYAGISDVIAGPAGKPGLYALRLSDGELVWSAPNALRPACRWRNMWCHGAVSQAVTAVPGVVFAGAYDGHFRAHRASDGKVIWDFDTGSEPIAVVGGRSAYGGVMDGAGPTVAGGMVFVHSGYAGRSGESGGRDLTGKDGNVLMAFSVEGR